MESPNHPDDVVRAHALRHSGVSRRRMFGAEAFFRAGRMFAFFGHQAVVVRLPDPTRSGLIREGKAFPYLPPGSVDREGWTELPYRRFDPTQLGDLIEAAYAYVPEAPASQRVKRPPSRRRRRPAGVAEGARS